MVVMKSDNHKLPHCEECECKLEEYKPEPEPIEETKEGDDGKLPPFDNEEKEFIPKKE